MRTNIINKDCIEVMKTMEDKCIDVIITDPPYNVNAKAFDQSKNKTENKQSYNDNINDYYNWSKAWLTEAIRIAKIVIFSPGHKNIAMWCSILPPDDYIIHYKPDGQGFSHSCRTTKAEIYLVYGTFTRINMNVIKANLNHFHRYTIHPHPKPKELYKQLLKELKPKTFFDPFLGSGNSVIAAELLQIKWSGCEIVKEYCNEIEERLNKIPVSNLYEI